MSKVSVIIPVFNEEKVITDCLDSLSNQTVQDMEIIVVDDGSSDTTFNVVSNLKFKISNLKLLQQNHRGPGMARNLGAKEARGNILVFVDADMTFDKKFIEMLTKPIRSGETVGTFSKYEYVLNKQNGWSRCWNVNKGLPTDRMHKKNYPEIQPVFRAILKKEFDKVGGFDAIGYVDDHTLSKKLGIQAVSAKGAIFYHRNPESITEVYKQARWVGKNEYKNRKIKIEPLMRLVAIIRYSLPFTLIIGIYKSLRHLMPRFLLFKLIYDFAVEVSLMKSFFGEQKYK